MCAYKHVNAVNKTFKHGGPAIRSTLEWQVNDLLTALITQFRIVASKISFVIFEFVESCGNGKSTSTVI